VTLVGWLLHLHMLIMSVRDDLLVMEVGEGMRGGGGGHVTLEDILLTHRPMGQNVKLITLSYQR
jgi:hypothetical protein